MTAVASAPLPHRDDSADARVLPPVETEPGSGVEEHPCQMPGGLRAMRDPGQAGQE
jgi:hypothetical protein